MVRGVFGEMVKWSITQTVLAVVINGIVRFLFLDVAGRKWCQRLVEGANLEQVSKFSFGQIRENPKDLKTGGFNFLKRRVKKAEFLEPATYQ